MATLVPDPRAGAAGPRRRGAHPGASAASATASRTCASCSSRWAATGADPVWSMGDDTPIPPLVGGPAESVRLLPPALRAGDQPAHRLPARGDGDVAPDAPGPARLAAARAARATRACCALEHPVLLAGGDGGAAQRRGLLDRDARRDLGHDPRRRRPPPGAHRAPPRGGARGAAGRAHPRSSATAPPTRRAPRSRCCSPIGAVRQHLVHTGLRARVGLVAEAGDAFDIHHFATLIGYGAEAVHPWLALETLDVDVRRGRETSRRERDADATPRPSPAEARVQYRTAAEKGLLKILSKMGISTLTLVLRRPDLRGARPGTRGHRRTCFAGTASPIGGIGFEEIAEDVLARHRAAYPDTAADGSVSLPDHGRVRFRKEGEDHGWAPPVVVALQQAVKSERRARRTAGSWSSIARRRPAGPRDLLARAARIRPCRSTRSSRRSRSGAGSCRRRCRSARSRPRRTPRSRSR